MAAVPSPDPAAGPYIASLNNFLENEAHFLLAGEVGDKIIPQIAGPF